MRYMKLFDLFNSGAVIGFLLLASATPSIAYPSVTRMCNEVRLELEKQVEEGGFEQQEVEPLLLRCRDLQ